MNRFINILKIFLLLFLIYVLSNIIYTISTTPKDRYCSLFSSSKEFKEYLNYDKFKNGICQLSSITVDGLQYPTDYFEIRDRMLEYLKHCKEIKYNIKYEETINKNFNKAVKELLNKYKDVNITE